ncbi:hypothetical protein CONPUDRAFT_165620 [Coniophora puteana RWD-64-598 SS2]|uniref:F-box domain-containing protein n=1 Tax=Coniophora puteana (strain RWD-64-598) TaxID=741705 RepID=A0A5M3MR08_CONPW|nr:uncharacterized protein CONPUDRAFT_165620 [Coniophora puteana RWD-64-598 SS2]EIW81496.1 hypothetical protein CONPUDRAFT_165620 [Coniophora puteana RWD-64-598 SS2]
MMPTPEETRTSISSLAPETLLEIFKFVHEWAHEPTSGAQNYEHRKPNDHHDLRLFPYSCAYVCRRWLDVLAMDPRFWRWTVIHIDVPFVTQHVMKTFFRASRDSLIRIYICYSGAPLMSPEHEHDRVATAMESARPHLSRCFGFNLRALYRSSTVLASRYLDGLSAPSLTKLLLTSAITDSNERFDATTLSCPNLRWLWLDAQSLVNFVLTNTGHTPPRKFPQSYLMELHATRYRPHGISNSLSSTSFAEAVAAAKRKSIFTFTLTDVEFANDYRPSSSSPTSLSTHPAVDPDLIIRDMIIRFTNMEGPSISRVLNYIIPELSQSSLVSIVDGDLAGLELQVRLPPQCRLSLHNIQSSSVLRIITDQWDGSELFLYSCPGFDDDFLQILADDMEFCSNLQILAIDGRHWSTAAMIRMCEARHSAERRLERLEVEGDIPGASGEELGLLETYVDHVDWIPGYTWREQVGRRQGELSDVQP